MHALKILEVSRTTSMKSAGLRSSLHKSAGAHLALAGYRIFLFLHCREKFLLRPWLKARYLVYEQDSLVCLVHCAAFDPEMRGCAEAAAASGSCLTSPNSAPAFAHRRVYERRMGKAGVVDYEFGFVNLPGAGYADPLGEASYEYDHRANIRIPSISAARTISSSPFIRPLNDTAKIAMTSMTIIGVTRSCLVHGHPVLILSFSSSILPCPSPSFPRACS